MSMEYGRYGLKSFSWGIADVFAADGSGHILTCCEDHFPLTYTDQNTNERHIIEADSEQVSPIFADYELDFYPSCDLCGKVWEYTNLTEEGISSEDQR